MNGVSGGSRRWSSREEEASHWGSVRGGAWVAERSGWKMKLQRALHHSSVPQGFFVGFTNTLVMMQHRSIAWQYPLLLETVLWSDRPVVHLWSCLCFKGDVGTDLYTAHINRYIDVYTVIKNKHGYRHQLRSGSNSETWHKLDIKNWNDMCFIRNCALNQASTSWTIILSGMFKSLSGCWRKSGIKNKYIQQHNL